MSEYGQLPPDWCHPDETEYVVYERSMSEGATFRVAVQQPVVTAKQYELRFSTINSVSGPRRHDYPIAGYEASREAIRDARALVETVDQHLEDESLSETDPRVEEVQKLIEAFTDDSFLLSFHDLISVFRR